MDDDIEEIGSIDYDGRQTTETVVDTVEDGGRPTGPKTRKAAFDSAVSTDTQPSKERETVELKTFQRYKNRRQSWVDQMDDDSEDPEIAQVFTRSAGTLTLAETALVGQQSPDKVFSPSHSRTSSNQNVGEGGSRPGTATGHVDLSSSMRLRIRQQAKSAVEKKRGAVQLTKRLQRRMSMSSTRYDSIQDARDDETRVADALQRSKQLSLRNKRSDHPHKSKVPMPSAQEQYDFFTKVYDQPKKEQESVAVEERAVDAETSDETTRLVGQAGDEPLVKLVRATMVSSTEQSAKEARLYFTPTRATMPMQQKVRGDVRRLEEEGFYVGPKRDSNFNALEQRLLIQPNANQWFAQDGRILGLDGNGLATFPLKPDVESGDDLVFYGKAVVGRQANATGIYQLDIDIAKMLFTHHPLFSLENLLAMRLLHMYRNYLSRSDENLAVYYDQRLQAVKQAIAQFEHLLDTQDHIDVDEVNRKVGVLKADVRELRKQRNDAEQMDIRLIGHMTDTWTQLNAVRDAQRFTSTPFRLLIRHRRTDRQQEKIKWDADLKEELREREQLFRLSSPTAIFDRDGVWNEIMATAQATRRHPGQSIPLPVLTDDGVITPNDQCPVDEKDRRAEIEHRKFIAQIFFNGLEVCKSTARNMNTEFSVTFGQIYNLQVYEWPQSITIVILEKAGKGDYERVASIGLPVPLASQVAGGDKVLDEMQFSCEQTVSAWKNAVGSGQVVQLPVAGGQPSIPRTTGVLQCCALWGRDRSGVPLVPTSHPSATLDQKLQEVDPKNVAAVQELHQLMQTSKFDPNDPMNAQFLSVLNDVERYGQKTAAEETRQSSQLKCFRLIPEECRLVDDEQFNNDIRFKLLELRRDQVPEFRALKMVPPYANEIDTEIFQRYEKRLEKERLGTAITGIDSLRAAGNRYAALIRAQVIDRFSKADRRKTLTDVVHEQPIPSFFGALGSLFGPADTSRKLKPQRKETQRQGVSGKEYKILINVQTGNNIPTRDSGEHARSDQVAMHLESAKVEPFVEVSFQDISVRTSVVEGRNPNWQQMLLLDFAAPNDDFSHENLKTVTDVLYLNLFDQVVSRLPSDSREHGHTVHEQVEKRWLGTIKLPFSTLYWNGKIEGALRVKTPPVYLGYSLGSQLDAVAHPYIKLLIAIEPALPRPEALSGAHFDTVESEQVAAICRQWLKLLETVNPDRRYVGFVTDTHGRTVLVSRFLRPIRPPSDVESLFQQSGRKGADLACHIASLVPFVSDPLMFPGVCDVWSTCDEFLRMLCGDEEEHCVLLWCWLSGLGLKCYVLLGNGLPEGPRAAYVLAFFADGTKVLYNASDGQAYDVHDPFCPLLNVGTLVTADNVYGNVQLFEQPSHMRFDIEKATDWRPMFPRSSPNPSLEPVQPHTLEYSVTDPMSVVELRGNLEREIKQRFDQWRPHGIPQWNFQAAKTLRDLLPLMEEGTLTAEEHTDQLKRLTESYKMCGVPLHMAYENVDKVVEAVKATNVHVNYNRDAEFALAVHIHPYTNNILSCWVYIASLVRLR